MSNFYTIGSGPENVSEYLIPADFWSKSHIRDLGRFWDTGSLVLSRPSLNIIKQILHDIEICEPDGDFLKGLLPATQPEAVATSTAAKGGRPRKHNWERAVVAVVCKYCFDAEGWVPQRQSDVEKELASWFASHGDGEEPASSELRVRASWLYRDFIEPHTR